MSFREYIFKAGNVKRFHTFDSIKEQTVSSHSWGVAIIVCDLVKNPSIELLKAALYHDVAEGVTGDIPATTKWRYPELDAFLKKAEAEIEEGLGIVFSLTSKERRILKFADMMELIITGWREYQLGNKNAEGLIERGVQFVHSHLTSYDQECWDYFFQVMGPITKELENE